MVEEYEEVVEQDDYEDELEYVEIKSSSEKTNERKTLYMENDYSVQSDNEENANQIDEEKNTDIKNQKKSNGSFISRRPIQNATETLDIEPLDEKNLVKDNKKFENFEIDDPW